MNNRLKLILSAITVSFLGSLPLGTLNLSIANFMFQHDLTGAIAFSVTAISMEMILVRTALIAIKRLERLKYYFRFFNLLTILVLFALSANMLIAAYQMRKFEVKLPFMIKNPVVSGLLLSIINPLHIPFWMGWTAAFKSKKILSDHPASYNQFVISIGIGTSLAFLIYGSVGSFLIGLLHNQQVLLNWIVGLILLSTALIQLITQDIF